ncbi:MAG TPA: hypothetical protein VHJ20_00285 [Polyangia bacterium]|nr:hypothetical protein [Polyangia bacterium]
MFSLGASAQAAQVTRFKLKDHSLIANLEDASDDGCFVTQTSVRFAEAVIFEDGDKTIQPPTTTIEVDYANACTGDTLTLTGGTTVQTFHIAGDLSTASLSAVVPVSDGVSSATVTLNLTWTANAPLQEAKDKTRTRDGNTVTVEKVDFQVRTADIGGTATTTLPTSEGPLAVDLARFPEGGTIGKDADGERTITRK